MQFLLPYTTMASSKSVMDDNLPSAVDPRASFVS
jgi:hypothetical protein